MRHIRALLIVACAAAVLPGTVFAADEAALGVIIGAPTGISGKMWKGERRAFDAAIGWSLGDTDKFYLHADYLIQDPVKFVVSEGKMPWYYGIGGRIRGGEDGRFGVRMPVGLEYLMQDAPLEFFIEMALVLDIIPQTGLDLNAGIGVRYRFPL